MARGWTALCLAALAVLSGSGGCGASDDPARDPCRHASDHGPMPCQTGSSGVK